MAGSFEIFRRHQRSLLVAVAILAMLAFFVLPPFLQMGSGGSVADPVVAAWQGGEIRESGMRRALGMRTVLNRFLFDAAVAAGRDASGMQFLPEDEEDVVRAAVMEREAEANGVVVSDEAVNRFLGQWTNNQVRPEQFEQLVARWRSGPIAVSQADVFEAVRSVLVRSRLQQLFTTGFAGDPPAWRWDYFRRLEQAASVEVVPVVVEEFSAEVPQPTEGVLRQCFETYRDTLPAARSADPGFKEPHRVRYAFVSAQVAAFEAAAAKEVTDDEIAKYYEDNKATAYRVAAPAASSQKPPADKPADTEAPKSPAIPVEPAKKPEDAGAPAPAAATGRTPFSPVAFRQPDALGSVAPSAPQPAPAAENGSAAQPAGDQPPATPPPAVPAKPDEAGKEASAGEFRPLADVRDEIRKTLAAERAERTIDGLFTGIEDTLRGFARRQALRQARDATGAPQPPDIAGIAKRDGLEMGTSDLVNASQAVASGGIGSSFELLRDPSSPLGYRQSLWGDTLFGDGLGIYRPTRTRDLAGTRYLSWKTEDQPEFVPSFQAARGEVERAWRIVEARPLAKRRAEEILRAAEAGKPLAEVVKDGPLQATTAGPFTWLARAPGSFGAAPALSRPEGISMPGDEFMRAVFSLDPGGVAVAFNEPRTVCYVIRLLAYEPTTEVLRDRFVDARTDQRRVAAVADQEQRRAATRWVEELERRFEVTWKRPPARPGR